MTYTEYSTAAEYTFLSSSHVLFIRIDHLLGHQTNFNRFKRIEIIQNMFSDHMESNYITEANRKISKHVEMVVDIYHSSSLLRSLL